MRKLYALLKNRIFIHKIKKLSKPFVFQVLGFICILFIAIPCAQADPWVVSEKKKVKETSFLEQSVEEYQKFLSRADGNRCPMYPSCSAYAKQAFHTHGFIKGWILTSDRLLRCGHDEIKLSDRKEINGKYYTHDPLNKNDFLFR